MKKFLTTLLLLTSPCFAQLAMRVDKAQQVVSGYVKPISNASVRVCLFAESKACENTISIYSDPQGTKPLSNPFNAAADGSYQYFVATGQNFVEQVSAPGLPVQSRIMSTTSGVDATRPPAFGTDLPNTGKFTKVTIVDAPSASSDADTVGARSDALSSGTLPANFTTTDGVINAMTAPGADICQKINWVMRNRVRGHGNHVRAQSTDTTEQTCSTDPFEGIPSGTSGLLEVGQASILSSAVWKTPNYWRIVGPGRGTEIKASPSLVAKNFIEVGARQSDTGVNSNRFDARLENLTVNCNDNKNIANCTNTETAQEHSGLEHVTVTKCITCVKIEDTEHTTPANWLLHDLEIYTSSVATSATTSTANLTASAAPVSIPVASTDGFIVGNVVHINNVAVTTTSSATLAASSSAVSVPVASSAGFVVGEVAKIGTGASAEYQIVTAIADGTHVTVQRLAIAHDGSSTPFSVAMLASREYQTVTEITDATHLKVAKLKYNHDGTSTPFNVALTAIGVDIDGGSSSMHDVIGVTTLGKTTDAIGIRINNTRGGLLGGLHSENVLDAILAADAGTMYGTAFVGISGAGNVGNVVHIAGGNAPQGLTFNGIARLGAAALIKDDYRAYRSTEYAKAHYSTGDVAGDTGPMFNAGFGTQGDAHIAVPPAPGSVSSKKLYFDARYNSGTTDNNIDSFSCNLQPGTGNPPISSSFVCSHSGISGTFRFTLPAGTIFKTGALHSLSLSDTVNTGYDQRSHTESTCWLKSSGSGSVCLGPDASTDALKYDGLAGTGAAQVCADTNGKLYRGSPGC